MANQLYPKGREAFLNGEIDWMDDQINVMLVDSDYTFSSAHDSLDDIPAGARLDTPTTLGTKNADDGVADAADVTFADVATGDTVDALVIYKYDATESNALLIAYINIATGLPATTNGEDITVAWDTDEIFTL